MKTLLNPTRVMQRDSRRANIGYTLLAVIVALALFVAAAGAGPPDYVSPNALADWMNVGANIVCIVFGVLILIPCTRIIGALFGVFYMFGAMYVNYTAVGIEFFVSAIPYNTVSLAMSSILVGHYFEDVFGVFGSKTDESGPTSAQQPALD